MIVGCKSWYIDTVRAVPLPGGVLHANDVAIDGRRRGVCGPQQRHLLCFLANWSVSAHRKTLLLYAALTAFRRDISAPNRGPGTVRRNAIQYMALLKYMLNYVSSLVVISHFIQI